LKLIIDGHKAWRGLSATAELLVIPETNAHLLQVILPRSEPDSLYSVLYSESGSDLAIT